MAGTYGLKYDHSAVGFFGVGFLFLESPYRDLHRYDLNSS
jgi:hypothetical protein